MRIVLQRVKQAKVKVNSEVIGNIQQGLLLFVGAEMGDGIKDIKYLVQKLINLRIFEDEKSKMNLSVHDLDGEILAVSQFTLLGDCSKGRRPSFDKAAGRDEAIYLYNEFLSELKKSGLRVEAGRFGAHMQVEIINDGPVTLIVDSRR